MSGHYYLVYLHFLQEPKRRLLAFRGITWIQESSLCKTSIHFPSSVTQISGNKTTRHYKNRQTDRFPCPLPGSRQLLDLAAEQRNPSGISLSRSQQQTQCPFEQISNGQPEIEICILQENKVLCNAVSLGFCLCSLCSLSFLLCVWHQLLWLSVSTQPT